MITHELYINDILMDIDKDVNIYLTYQSPIFTDLKATISHHTNNISLPLTAKNKIAIEMYHLADKEDNSYSKGTFPRRWHQVMYYRNGILICKSGRGVFNGIGDGRIGFAFTWGNIENFKELTDKQLNQLKFGDTISWYDGASYLKNTDDASMYGFYNFDFGMGSDKKIYQHPCVRTNFILNQIALDSKITINNKRNNTYMTKDLLIPCISKKANGKTNDSATLYSSDNILKYVEERDPSIPKEYDLMHHGYLHPNKETLYDPFLIWDDVSELFEVEDFDKIKITISDFIVRVPHGPRGCLPPHIAIGINDKIIQYAQNNSSVEGYSFYSFDETSIELDVSSVKEVKILVVRADYNYPNIVLLQVPTVNVVPYVKECEYGHSVGAIQYPIAINLPEMTQVEFIQAMMHINGLFATVKKEQTIDFISVDDIVDNLSKALDWTNKLVNPDTSFNTIDSIDFRLSGFAQKNICQYSNDDDIKQQYNGAIIVSDETLESSKVIFELPFSQTNNKGIGVNRYAVIPLYKQGDTKNDVTYNEGCKPRILLPKIINGTYSASFEQLDWDYLLRTRYKSYQKMVRNPRLLKVRCRLNEVDLSQLDFAIPIWFSQFGAYYIVIKIQSVANGLCNCEFLEIKTDQKEMPGMPGEIN